MKSKSLVIGACGQIGSELTAALEELYGSDRVIAADINAYDTKRFDFASYINLDATDREQLEKCIFDYQISEVYLMAALLSAKSENEPHLAWRVNIATLLNVLSLAKTGKIKKVFWPSSIAVFGPTSPKQNTPQHTITEPTSVYGISKLAGERWCEYYFEKFNVDVRSIRLPGVISHKTAPGGGTTDYAVEIFHKVISGNSYDCFLNANTMLPMIYISDVIRSIIQIMSAEKSCISVRSSYNLSAMSFSPKEIYSSIKKFYPNFKINYKPDFRQQIADTWPNSIDDTQARSDWGWKEDFDLDSTTSEMIKNLSSLQ